MSEENNNNAQTDPEDQPILRSELNALLAKTKKQTIDFLRATHREEMTKMKMEMGDQCEAFLTASSSQPHLTNQQRTGHLWEQTNEHLTIQHDRKKIEEMITEGIRRKVENMGLGELPARLVEENRPQDRRGSGEHVQPGIELVSFVHESTNEAATSPPSPQQQERPRVLNR
eukprot:CAMPEP_0194423970 /NCGR_PEP_ID=MMETSP0176-20130528/23232_1 /TAXON_ID=216777 /ORGANISM="Proboscia alata, Strain PI-D3" /LENGTH=171 /DNA_ID=CAMNT_0039233471 /DNA_START=80 /DNA_END=592 /DNA_ORIENTATION=+